MDGIFLINSLFEGILALQILFCHFQHIIFLFALLLLFDVLWFYSQTIYLLFISICVFCFDPVFVRHSCVFGLRSDLTVMAACVSVMHHQPKTYFPFTIIRGSSCKR